jgi:hypothetical protein
VERRCCWYTPNELYINSTEERHKSAPAVFVVIAVHDAQLSKAAPRLIAAQGGASQNPVSDFHARVVKIPRGTDLFHT